MALPNTGMESTGGGSTGGTVTIASQMPPASLPLPNGAATESTLAAVSAKLNSVPVTGTVAVSGTVPVSGTVTTVPSGTQTVAGTVTTTPSGTQTVAGTVAVTGTVPVSAVAMPLPAGAATETTLGTRLSEATFTARTPATGQANMANSSPVVIASNQSAVPVSGTVSVGTVPVTDNGGSLTVDGTVGISGTVPVSGTVAISGTVPVSGTVTTTPSGTQTVSGTVAVSGTVPVSAAALPLPSGAATEASLTAASAKLPATLGQKTTAASMAVALPSDMPALPVSGTVAVSGTVPVSAAALPLPAGAATEATLATRLTEATFTARTPVLGQAAMAASTPVVLPINQGHANVVQNVTYSASILSLALAASATDVFTIAGANGKVIRVSRIVISGVATSAAMALIQIIKRSTVDTGGTSTAPTKVPNDPANVTASLATIAAYTANPAALGTPVGLVAPARLPLPAPATAVGGAVLTFNFGAPLYAQAQELKSATDQLCVNLNGATFAGGILSITVEYTEI